MPAFILVLSQSIPVGETSRRLRVNRDTVAHWLMCFRQLIEQKDPDRQWISRANLGLPYRPEGTCLHCVYSGQLASGGLGIDHRRRAKCPQCGRTWPIAEDAAATRVKVSIVHDPASSQVALRRRKGLKAPVLAVAVEGGLSVPPRQIAPILESPEVLDPQAQRFDFAQPLGPHSALPRHYSEDSTLTVWLWGEIDKVLAQDIDLIPSCPHCASDTVHHVGRQRQALHLPVFRCERCTRTFTRVTRTALANSLRPDILNALLPWLAQQRPIVHAAQALGVPPETIIGLAKQFRTWLVCLDPSGQYERRVRLRIV